MAFETYERIAGLREWLKQCLEFPNGIPSHATCGRVFAMLNSQAVRRRFMA
ncbi:MAG TPA: hypothetical protein DEF43_01185 [Chloroflexus aurantiacus]|uniref:transposase family protein n=1 Tax=Chloroflexus TaxID=1107 RepID=UPI000A05650C|nr:hypothetical protein [Chloroflexus aurantiacus]